MLRCKNIINSLKIRLIQDNFHFTIVIALEINREFVERKKI